MTRWRTTAIPSFGGNGRGQFGFITGPVTPSLYIDYNDAFHAPVAVQRDGKIVLAATVKTLSGQDIGVLRINADGSRDATFGPSLNGQSIVTFNLGGSNETARMASRSTRTETCRGRTADTAKQVTVQSSG